MTERIESWNKIKEDFTDGTILLGNGASISVHSEFDYKSLKEHAIKKTPLGEKKERISCLFGYFETDDFELILRNLRQAELILNSLIQAECISKNLEEFRICHKEIENTYNIVRKSLISAVKGIHPEPDEVDDKMESIYNFIKEFKTIISLNYDLLIYWAIMRGNDKDGIHAIKDCFVKEGKEGEEFDHNWERLRKPIWGQKNCSLVFYPHGNLALARDKNGKEKKIAADSNGGLLESIVDKWKAGVLPLFVSEGTSEQKQKSIRNSDYLRTVYWDVLPNLGSKLTIYGFNFNKNDLHILQGISKSKIKKVAVSVYRKDPDKGQDFCNNARQVLTDHFDKVSITFFDSESKECWIKAGKEA